MFQKTCYTRLHACVKAIVKAPTETTASLAAMAIISAQETIPGHAISNANFIRSITSKPLSEFLFGTAFFSLTIPSTSSKRTDASHPCNANVKNCMYHHKAFELSVIIKLTFSS